MTSVFHYTSGAALLGIISNSEFWATDISFLNDDKEHVTGYEASLEYIEELKEKEDDPILGDCIKMLYQQLITYMEKNTIARQTYVVSFSKTPDSIVHWFSYCEKNQGYCLEFEEETFLEGDEPDDPPVFSNFFMDVNYAEAELLREELGKVISKQSIMNIIQDAQSSANLLGVDLQDRNAPLAGKYLLAVSNRLMNEMFSPLIILSCSYKGKGFSHEAERRLVLLQKNLDANCPKEALSMKFREKNGAIFPYTPIRFNRNSIKRIIIGPCADYDFKRSGLLKLLKKYNLECKVEQSSSSLRFT